MALIQCSFSSAVLGKACQMNIIIPQSPINPADKPYPVLYLLHGLAGDHSSWMRRTSIERYAAAYDLVIVMPNGDRSFYTDAQKGFRYWTMLSEELPQVVSSMLPVSTDREKTFAAGLSMGGYGALKLALRCPDKFAAAAGLSSVADIKNRIFKHQPTPELERIFLKDGVLADPDNDLMLLADKALKFPTPPRIMSVCGTEDGLYENNQTFRRHMEAINYPNYTYLEGPGSHSWDFWDKWIPTALQFLMEK
ncbi:MAG: esterase family protein [Victivallales bacterium]|nr:esterase family protein [Victivallales bacterium]